ASLHQPFRQSAVFAEAWQLRKQVHTDGLKDVARILIHSELDRNRVDEVLVLVDQCRPGFLIALQTAADQLLVRRVSQRRIGGAFFLPSCRGSRHRTPAFSSPGPRTYSSSAFHNV